MEHTNYDRHSISEDVRVFVDFLTCRILTVCTQSDRQSSEEASAIKYEMPLQSVQHVDETGAWGARNAEQESTKPSKIARAINFSSNRLDNEHDAIALYDENRLRQEVQEVEIPEEYLEDAFDAANNEVYEEFSFLQAHRVPDAIIVKPTTIDDVSILEDSSIDSLGDPCNNEDPRNNKAWSLSPRRKRLLKARARAVAMKTNE